MQNSKKEQGGKFRYINICSGKLRKKVALGKI
jgi:hypothetical protein